MGRGVSEVSAWSPQGQLRQVLISREQVSWLPSPPGGKEVGSGQGHGCQMRLSPGAATHPLHMHALAHLVSLRHGWAGSPGHYLRGAEPPGGRAGSSVHALRRLPGWPQGSSSWRAQRRCCPDSLHPLPTLDTWTEVNEGLQTRPPERSPIPLPWEVVARFYPRRR